MSDVSLLNQTGDFSSPSLLHSPWICSSRGSSRRARGGLEERRLQTVSSLFEDLDPDSSPLLKHLERKKKSGAKLTDDDFTESFPLFKKKMEREFDEITEKFKRLSIENPEINDIDESDFCQEFVTKLKEEEDQEISKGSSRLKHEDYFNDNFKSFIITNILLQLTLEGINLMIWVYHKGKDQFDLNIWLKLSQLLSWAESDIWYQAGQL